MAVLSIAGREIDSEEEYALKGDEKRKTWELVGNAEEVQLSAARREIIEYLNETPGQYPKEIAAALDKKNTTISQTLRRMLQDGEVRVDAYNRYHPTTTSLNSRGGSSSHSSHKSHNGSKAVTYDSYDRDSKRSGDEIPF